jgi:acetyltransferase
MGNLDGKEGELAIVVGDPWQGKGVGETLFQHGLAVAKQRGIESLVGMVAAENTTVLSLVRKLGFRVKWDSRDHVYHITMDLKSVDLKDLKDTAR